LAIEKEVPRVIKKIIDEHEKKNGKNCGKKCSFDKKFVLSGRSHNFIVEV